MLRHGPFVFPSSLVLPSGPMAKASTKTAPAPAPAPAPEQPAAAPEASAPPEVAAPAEPAAPVAAPVAAPPEVAAPPKVEAPPEAVADAPPASPVFEPPVLALDDEASVPPVLDPPMTQFDLVLATIEQSFSAFETSERLVLEVRKIAEMVCDGPAPPSLSESDAAKVIDALVSTIRKAVEALGSPRMIRLEIEEHARRMTARARRLDGPKPKPVEYFEVTATSRFIIGGSITSLAEGSIISSLTHSIAEVEAQGVPLRRCGAPVALPSAAASGFQVSPSHDFEIQEHADPILRALGGVS